MKASGLKIRPLSAPRRATIGPTSVGSFTGRLQRRLAAGHWCSDFILSQRRALAATDSERTWGYFALLLQDG